MTTVHFSSVLRITPAWAGKSLCYKTEPSTDQDHPRVGGEKPTATQGRKGVAGSPPRGRGKVTTGITTVTALRITPAWAGKSVVCDSSAFSFKDHPRVGGEKRNGVQ